MYPCILIGLLVCRYVSILHGGVGLVVCRNGSGRRGPGFDSCSLETFFKRTFHSKIGFVSMLKEKEWMIRGEKSYRNNLSYVASKGPIKIVMGQKILNCSKILFHEKFQVYIDFPTGIEPSVTLCCKRLILGYTASHQAPGTSN